MRGQPPVLHRIRASTASPPPRRRIGRRGARRRIRPPRAIAGVEGMPGRRRAVEITARGVEADAPPSEERGRRRRGGRTATATGGRAPVAAEGEDGDGERGAADEREEGGGGVGGGQEMASVG
jgi:hypothetical protein